MKSINKAIKISEKVSALVCIVSTIVGSVTVILKKVKDFSSIDK